MRAVDEKNSGTNEKKSGINIVTLYNTLTQEKINNFLITLCEEVQFDLRPLNKKLILDTFELDVKEAKENLDEIFDIYCLGMPNETVPNLMRTIRENDTRFDWTNNIGQFSLERVCHNIIERSKILQKECEKYNVAFFDTSGNREEKLKFVIEEIKKKSINN